MDRKIRFSGGRLILRVTALAVAAGALFFENGARAQTVFSASEAAGSFGMYGQLNSAVTVMNPLNVGPQACVPTATTNALAFLANTYGVSNLVMPDGYDTVNTLAVNMGTVNNGPGAPNNGTTFTNQKSGLNTYLNAQGVSSTVSIASEAAVPTVVDLYTWLNAGAGITINIDWTDGGGHALTLYSIIYTVADDGSISGSMGFWDPYSAPAGASSTAFDITAATFVVTSGTININGGYTGGAAGSSGDPDNPGASATGTIADALEIVAVPEPSVVVLLALVVPVLLYLRRRRLAS